MRRDCHKQVRDGDGGRYGSLHKSAPSRDIRHKSCAGMHSRIFHSRFRSDSLESFINLPIAFDPTIRYEILNEWTDKSFYTFGRFMTWYLLSLYIAAGLFARKLRRYLVKFRDQIRHGSQSVSEEEPASSAVCSQVAR